MYFPDQDFCPLPKEFIKEFVSCGWGVGRSPALFPKWKTPSAFLKYGTCAQSVMEECTYHWHHQHNHRFLAYVYAMIAFPWLSRFGHIILQMFLSKSGCWMRLFLIFSNTVPSFASWINDLSNMMFFSFFLSTISHGTRDFCIQSIILIRKPFPPKHHLLLLQCFLPSLQS